MSDSEPGAAAMVVLPKAHLHVHLMGSIRPGTLRELAERAGVEVTDPPESFPDWASFYVVYGATKRVLRDSADLARLVGEVVADAAADGGPHRRIERSGTRPGDRVGLVVAADRDRDVAAPMMIAELAVAWAGRGVVGFGLAGDEVFSCVPFAPAAALARDAGLLVVPHAGELAGPGSVREVLEHLEPDRIMHGVRAIEDPNLVAELVARGVVLDVCPTSNVALGVVDDLACHPLPDLVRAGVRCSINADDTRVFATGLATEYERAGRVLGLTDHELAVAARTSLTASAAPRELVDRALDGVDRWVRSRST